MPVGTRAGGSGDGMEGPGESELHKSGKSAFPGVAGGGVGACESGGQGRSERMGPWQ